MPAAAAAAEEPYKVLLIVGDFIPCVYAAYLEGRKWIPSILCTSFSFAWFSIVFLTGEKHLFRLFYIYLMCVWMC